MMQDATFVAAVKSGRPLAAAQAGARVLKVLELGASEVGLCCLCIERRVVAWPPWGAGNHTWTGSVLMCTHAQATHSK